jgi:flavin-dependent dehydrogenase
MEMSKYDLVVGGGGPAGTAAAITAARSGARVLLLEQGHFPRQKVCGEFVSCETIPLLRKLLSPDGEFLNSAVKTTEARLFFDQSVARVPIPPATTLPRYDLDFKLWEAAANSGADCWQNVTIDAVEEYDRIFHVHTTAGSFLACAVIDATGRWSKLRPEFRATVLGTSKWLGLKAHFSEKIANDRTTDLYFFEGGYCGIQPLPNGEINVCAKIRADVATRLERVFELHPALFDRSKGWLGITEVTTTAPLIFREPQPVISRILRVGDAAGFIDPFVGNGVSIALSTGALAAESLRAVWTGASLEESLERYRTGYLTHFSRQFRIASQLRQILSAPKPLRYIATRAMQIPIISNYVFTLTR